MCQLYRKRMSPNFIRATFYLPLRFTLLQKVTTAARCGRDLRKTLCCNLLPVCVGVCVCVYVCVCVCVCVWFGTAVCHLCLNARTRTGVSERTTAPQCSALHTLTLLRGRKRRKTFHTRAMLHQTELWNRVLYTPFPCTVRQTCHWDAGGTNDRDEECSYRSKFLAWKWKVFRIRF